MIRTLLSITVTTIVAATGLSGVAGAQTLVLGSSNARLCYEAALAGDQGSRQALLRCETAIGTDALSRRDWAATQVNYGILLHRAGRSDHALRAYGEAIDTRPELAEIWLNRGIVWLAMSDFAAAEADFTRSLELNIANRHQAYYNRALSFDAREMYREAYDDYQRALAERPGWELPLLELQRYRVVSGSR